MAADADTQGVAVRYTLSMVLVESLGGMVPNFRRVVLREALLLPVR